MTGVLVFFFSRFFFFSYHGWGDQLGLSLPERNGTWTLVSYGWEETIAWRLIRCSGEDARLRLAASSC